MRRLWEIHHLYEFQALTDNFFMWEWMLSDSSNLSDNSILTLYTVYTVDISNQTYDIGETTCFSFYIIYTLYFFLKSIVNNYLEESLKVPGLTLARKFIQTFVFLDNGKAWATIYGIRNVTHLNYDYIILLSN